MVRVLPPPTSGADVLTRLDSSCTRLAPDAREALVVQFVERHAVLADIFLDLFFCPQNERVKFDDIVSSIVLDHLHIGSGDRLFPAQSADPDFDSLQCSLERFHFSDVAAQVTELHAVVEQVDAMLLDHLLDIVPVREKDLDPDSVLHIGPVYKVISLRELTACIEREYSRVLADADHHVGYGLVFIAEA